MGLLFRGPHPIDQYLMSDLADLSPRCSGSHLDLGYLRKAMDLDQRCSGPQSSRGYLTGEMILHQG